MNVVALQTSNTALFGTLSDDLVPGVFGSGYPGPGQGGPGVPLTVGTGPNSVRLGLSEDADAGDAQFILTVDGRQVGPI